MSNFSGFTDSRGLLNTTTEPTHKFLINSTTSYYPQENDTTQQSITNSTSSVIYDISLLTVSVPLIGATIGGNAIVIFVWILEQSLRSPSALYFLSLAIADFITGVFVSVFFVLNAYERVWKWGEFLCRFQLTSALVLYAVSAFHLVAIAIDRYRILFEGAAYLARRTYGSAVQKLVLIWILAIWVVFPIILDWDRLAIDPRAETYCVSKKVPYWVVHYCIASFWAPAIFLVAIYAKIFLQVRKKLRRKVQARTTMWFSPPGSNEEASATSVSSSEQNVVRRERRSAITVTVISVVFILCWMPWNFLCLMDAVGAWIPSPRAYIISVIVGLGNSCANPIIYFARMPEFRRAFKQVLPKSMVK